MYAFWSRKASRYKATTNYWNYYRRSFDLLAPNGVIVIDNVLWSGDVLKQRPPDEATAAIQGLNRFASTDPRMIAVLVTIRVGFAGKKISSTEVIVALVRGGDRPA